MVATLCQRDWKCIVKLKHEMSAQNKGGEGELHPNEPERKRFLRCFIQSLLTKTKTEITHHTAFE